MYQQVCISGLRPSSHRLCLCDFYKFQRKQRLFSPHLINDYVIIRRGVFTVQYEINLSIYIRLILIFERLCHESGG